MPHLWRWQHNPLTLPRRFRIGSDKLHRQIYGSTYGSFKKEEHSISTIACTVLIPVSQTRYYVDGGLSGKASYKKWETKLPPICGYARTGHITKTGIKIYKRTRRRYKNLSLRIWQGTAPVLRINILWTFILPITPSVGGGVPESQQNC